MKKILAITALLATSAIANEVPKTIELKTDTVNAILQYLGTRPINEALGLVQQIQKESADYVAKLNAKKAETKEKTKP